MQVDVYLCVWVMRALVHVNSVVFHHCHEGLDHLLVADTGGDHQRGFAGTVELVDAPPRFEGKIWVLDKVVGWDGAQMGR